MKTLKKKKNANMDSGLHQKGTKRTPKIRNKNKNPQIFWK